MEFDKYPRIIALETRIAAPVCKRISGKVYLPPFVVKSKPIYFATDNIDICESTPDGTNTLHGTIITLFQKKYDDDISMVEPLYIETINKEYVPLSDYDVQLSLLPTMKLMQPIAEKFDHFSYNSLTRQRDSLIESDAQSTEKALVWLASCHSIMKASSCSVENTNIRNEDKPHISTWAAFNSFMTKKPQETNHGAIAPLLRSSPTSPQALYTALCLAQKINACVMGNGRTTVITLDLDLYERAVKIRATTGNKEYWVLRLGELHIMFALLKALGKYIEGSGIDDIWIESGLYGPAVTRQIFSGKHFKRGIEAHVVNLIALTSLYFDSVSENSNDTHEFLTTIPVDLCNAIKNQDCYQVTMETTKLSAEIGKLKLLQMLNNLEIDNPNELAVILLSYIAQVGNLLTFVRATREANFQLHLSSLDENVKYFFAHDLYKYARLTPYYLADMKHTGNF